MSDTLGPYTHGEIPPPLVYTYEDNQGALAPITGFTGKFVLLKAGASDAVIRDVDLDSAHSTVTYVWEDDDFDAVGTGFGQFWVYGQIDGNDQKYASVDYEWDVEEAVGALIPPGV